MADAKNVLGEDLKTCCTSPMTGFYRNGACETGPADIGTHVVCAEVTKDFLEFTRSRGNDLMSPAPHHGFPGLKPGDRWCLCVSRWKEALDAGLAPPVILAATHEATLKYVSLEELNKHAVSIH
ncbi:MAG: DUF2237 domain-containing protein [Deltaproteobacteria bacterium]|nr:DUF2237 domain-containing protein [Deltaproteobacteria bacterium]